MGTIRDFVVMQTTGKKFRTHSNYLGLMKELSMELTINERYSLKRSNKEVSDKLYRKLRLIETFKKSIDREFEEVIRFTELATISNTWIATKSYYLLFHMWIIVYCLILSEETRVNIGHKKINDFIKEGIESGGIWFSNEEFNQIYSYSEIDSLKVSPGGHLGTDDEQTKRYLLRKIGKAKIEELKIKEGIASFRKIKYRLMREKLQSSQKNYLFEFFYVYRIKNHYRDLDFLSENNNTHSQLDYYEKYYKLTCNFYDATKKLINSLSKKRYGKGLIK